GTALVEDEARPDANIEPLSLIERKSVHAHRPRRDGRPCPGQALVELARQRAVSIDRGPVLSSEDAGAEDMVGMVVRVDDRPHRPGRTLSELGPDCLRNLGRL